MREFRELTEMHQEMCHRLVEVCREWPNDPKRFDILHEIMEFERMVENYMGAKMENYRFVKYEDQDCK